MPDEVSEIDQGGRPTKYKASYNKIVKALCLLGATDKEIADALDISESTLNLWKQKHPRFSESLIKGKIHADAQVAEAFHKRAVGYRYKEETFERVGSKEELEATTESEILTTEYRKKVTIKEVPPDAGAALSWLKNRQPDKWRDKQEVESKNVNYYSVELDPTKVQEIAKALTEKY